MQFFTKYRLRRAPDHVQVSLRKLEAGLLKLCDTGQREFILLRLDFLSVSHFQIELTVVPNRSIERSCVADPKNPKPLFRLRNCSSTPNSTGRVKDRTFVNQVKDR